MSAVPGRARKRVRALWVALATFVVAVLVAEGVARIDALFTGAQYSSAGAQRFFESRADESGERALEAFSAPDPKAAESSLRPIPAPWTGWTNERMLRQIDEGVLWFASEPAQRAFDVLIVGGSVAAQFGNASEQLVEFVAADPKLSGREVHVWNLGLAGSKEPQPCYLVSWLLSLGWRPDLVLVLDGFNEVALAQSNGELGVHPLYPFHDYWTFLARDRALDVRALDLQFALRARQLEEQRLARQALAYSFQHSALLTRITHVRLTRNRRGFEAARTDFLAYLATKTEDLGVAGPTFERDEQAIVQLAVRGWMDAHVELDALCRARGIACLHVLQPALHDVGSKVLTSEEQRDGAAQDAWATGARLGYPLLRAKAAELAGRGLEVLDLSRVFSSTRERRYVDLVHVNADGLREFHAVIAPRIRALVR